ncbi:unnamed protein product [Anisakis simplex]|uniref:HARE-HTH domain-containing protein n=1 Tax=Anisakis simplex TaxID=6269 RepID=A0A0M3KGM5_ANISI|nr:unnamed protein product [Anisakis simplex]
MGNKDIIENEQNDIVALANSLKWLNSSENRQNVLLTLLRVISSYKDPKATRLSISSLSGKKYDGQKSVSIERPRRGIFVKFASLDEGYIPCKLILP